MAEPLLDIRSATKVYGGGLFGARHRVEALRDFSLTIPDEDPARITTIAGASGSGKTTLAHAVLGFVSLTSGQIRFRGRDIARMSRAETLSYRRQVQAIFQNPYEVYNPFYRVRHVFDLVVRRFGIARGRAEARDRIEQALNQVGLRGDEVLAKHPHQLSGGQRQRIMIARACLLKPRLIVADEPVSMVDASLRAMILDIMMRLRDRERISFIYITHDLSTAYQLADDIHVLRDGSVVESGNAVDVIDHPKHPYVRQLIRCIPIPDPTVPWDPENEP